MSKRWPMLCITRPPLRSLTLPLIKAPTGRPDLQYPPRFFIPLHTSARPSMTPEPRDHPEVRQASRSSTTVRIGRGSPQLSG